MRGGARQGAGRKKGALTKRTQEIAAAALKDGVTPLDYLLGVLRNTEKDEKDRFAAAVAAAPYVHPKLASVEHSGEMKMTHEQALDEIEAAERAAMNGHEQAH
jgi:uncharacterized caspase-like protein